MTARRIVTSVSTLAVFAAALAAVGAAPSRGALAYGPPPGGPDLSLAAFAVSDFPGARVKRQGYVKPDPDFGFIAEYDRDFRALSVRLGGKRLFDLEDDVGLARDSGDAGQAIALFRIAFGLGSKAVRKGLAKSFGVKPGSVKVGSPIAVGAGDESIAVRADIHTRTGEIDIVYAAVRVGAVDSVFYVAGVPKVRLGRAETRRLAKLAVRRMRKGLAPMSRSRPRLWGIPQALQTLRVNPGAWRNASNGFTYRWQRCNASGSACVGIADTKGSSYVLMVDDIGRTLRVAVSARNKYGSATSLSRPTPVVIAYGPPVNTSPPTISGSATVGQTLTANPGTWSGPPTSYTYRWQRCTSQGTDCSDIAGASSQPYLIVSADVGSTLRVVVTATNSLASGSVVSAPTSVVT